MSNICYVVCTYSKPSNNYSLPIKAFIDAKLDNFFILLDNQQNISIEDYYNIYNYQSIISYTNNDFEYYQFNKPINSKHRWGSHQNPKYFYAHFRMLLFYIRYPVFDYYWFFDDDVTFSGNIKKFLLGYSKENEDFLAIQAFKKENYVEFPKISIINNRMGGSRGCWLDWCPGPGDHFQSVIKHIGSFFPIVRYSNKSMRLLLDLHNKGFYGYSEGFVPTSIASNNMTVASMMNEHNSFFVDNESNCTLFHKGIQFTWEWL